MLGKNSSQKRWQNVAKQDHFAIRKLSIGAVSILLGIAFLASSQTVKADAVTDSSNIQKTKLTTYSDLNSFLKRNDDVKTSRDNKKDLATDPAIVEKNHTSAGKEGPAHTVQTQADHIHQGKWNNINVTYDDDTQELTLLGGTEDVPAIMQNGEKLEPLYKFLPNVSGDRNTLKKITIQSKIKAQGSASGLFNGLGGLASVEGLTNLDTSEVIDMSRIFGGCWSLPGLDVSHFNTSKVTNMESMFYDCESLTSLDLTHFDTSSVTDMSNIFGNCHKLSSLDLSHFDTSKVTNMSSMFEVCYSLTSLDLTHFDTSKVTDMSNMFQQCRGLTSLDVSQFNTSKVTNMSGMFDVCYSLTSLDLSHFNTSQVTNMSGMFANCEHLTNLNVSQFNTSQVTDMSNTFFRCPDLTTLDVSHFDTSKVINMFDMFRECSSLTSLDVSHFNTSSVTNMDAIFAVCQHLTSLDVSHFDTSNVTDMCDMFGGCNRLNSLDVSHFNTSKVTNMSNMFGGNNILTSLDLSHFDTSKVTDMSWMFCGCENLTSLDLSHFDTSKVTDMNLMFYYCNSLTSLDLSHFDTSKVTNMFYMFGKCWSLTSLDVSHFDTSKVTNMNDMFYECKNLTSLDVSHFDTSKVTSMIGMFAGCQHLTSLDLSRFDTSKVTDMRGMFSRCQELKQLSLGKNFKFLQEQKTGLDVLPGKWINLGVANQQLPKGTKQWTSKEFAANYNGATDYDTYVRFINFGGPITVHYCDQNGNKIPNIADEQQYGNIGDSLIDKTNPNSLLSFKRKEISGYNFDHAEIAGQTVNLTDIKYTENPQTLTLFYVKANSDNNGGNNTNDSNNTNGSDNTNDLNESNSQNNPNNSGSIKIPVEFATNVTLKHNAYLYDDNGKRANSVTFKADSIITVSGNKNINGRRFYILFDEGNKKHYYVAVGNAKAVSRKLKHNAYIYNKYGQRIKKTGVYKKRHYLNTFGDPVTIRGHRYFIIDNGRFVKTANFALKHSTKKAAAKVNNSGNKTIMHNAYLYNSRGKRANGIIILAGSKINTLNSVKINNRLYYKLEDGLHIAAGNINASKMKLKHNAYIYSQYGNRMGKKVLKKRRFVKTYGDAVSIKHKKYYITAKNKFVKKANFR